LSSESIDLAVLASSQLRERLNTEGTEDLEGTEDNPDGSTGRATSPGISWYDLGMLLPPKSSVSSISSVSSVV